MLLWVASADAQKLVLTSEGFRSSTGEAEIEFDTNTTQEEAYKLCIANTTKPGNVQFSVDRVKNKKLTIYGFIENFKYLVFGSKQLRFVITLNFSAYDVSASAIITNLKGNEIKYKRLFSSKTGTSKFNSVKVELEDCINEKIYDLVEGAVEFETKK